MKRSQSMKMRNRCYLPHLNEEGVFLKAIPVDDNIKNKKKCEIHERLHAHHTLSSARRFAYFQTYRDKIPSDALDIALTANYNQEQDLFADKFDCYLQPDTMGQKTWRRLRNTKDLPVPPSDNIQFNTTAIGGGKSVPNCGKFIRVPVVPYRYNMAHRVLITGTTDRRDPNNVKLMNSSHHSSQTNPGYSRQSLDGNIYQY